MAKLYFRYGSVSSDKTLNLLAVAHNYKSQGKGVFLLKPSLDNRFGQESISSRAGLEAKADFLAEKDSNLDFISNNETSCILVDEAQFLSSEVIEQLRQISSKKDIPVICYGLRTDFRGHLFEGSKRLMELCDSIEEIKTTCSFCNRKAIFNLKMIDGVPTLDGPKIELGAEEKYLPSCSSCYYEKVEECKSKVTNH